MDTQIVIIQPLNLGSNHQTPSINIFSSNISPIICYSRVNAESQADVGQFNCLSKMFTNNLLTTWTRNDQNSAGKSVKIKFDDRKGKL